MKASLRNAGEAGLSCCKLPINLSSAFWWALGRPGTRSRAPQWVNRNIIIGYDTRRWSTNRATLLLFGTLRDMYYIHIYMCIYVCMYVLSIQHSHVHPFCSRLPGQLAQFRVCTCNAAQSGWDVAGSLRAMKTSVAAWGLFGVAAIWDFHRRWWGHQGHLGEDT